MKPDHLPDPRHAKLRDHICTAYAGVNDGLCCSWSAKHAGILKNFLNSCPWKLEVLIECVDNRFQSEEINLCADPAQWITKLVNYARGPLDKYQRPIYQQKPKQHDWREGFESAHDYFERKVIQ